MGFLDWLKRRGSWREIRRSNNAPYLERYFLLKLLGRSIYLHRFWDSDEGDLLHDHPWRNISILLKGSYYENFYDGSAKTRRRGSIILRSSQLAHRIDILADARGQVWSLFLTGSRTRLWGFYTPKGWIEASAYGVSTVDKSFKLVGWLFPKVVWLTEGHKAAASLDSPSD